MELTGEQVAAVGRKIYEGIREEMEANHWGELVVIDVHSGDYEVGDYDGLQSDMEITKRLMKRHPDAFTWAELVGEKQYISARLSTRQLWNTWLRKRGTPMIRGQVMPSEDYSTGLEARISIEIVGANQIFQTLESVVDTGFEGPSPCLNGLPGNWAYSSTGTRPLTLASGQTIQTDTCVARLLWHGLPVDARAYVMGNKPMIGTTLLAGSRLSIDWWDGGDVIIEERTPPAE